MWSIIVTLDIMTHRLLSEAVFKLQYMILAVAVNTIRMINELK